MHLLFQDELFSLLLKYINNILIPVLYFNGKTSRNKCQFMYHLEISHL